MTILHELITQLNSSDASVRARSAYVVGTVDEVSVLDLLYQHYNAEGDVAARQAILWAGKRLKVLSSAGYTTLDALISHFRLLSPEVKGSGSAEQAVIDDFKLHTHSNTLRDESRGAVAKTVLTLALLPPIFSAGRFLAGDFTGAAVSATLSGMDSAPIEPLARRHTPSRPNSQSITSVLRRLENTAEPARRLDLVLDLAQVHNSVEALPHLAALFIRDDDEKVRETAQRAAKLIYWGALYWDMHDDGSLGEELARRQPPPASAASSEPHASPPTPDIATILRQAEEARERRKRGK